jgi:hypothetical protein
MKRLSFIILISLLSLSACGVKGPLQPKGKPEPKPVSALKMRQQGETVLLNWAIPSQNQDGTALSDLVGFRVNLYSYQPERYCPECKDQENIATIRIDNPAPAAIVDNAVYFRTTAITQNRGYRYRIQPFTKSGKNGPMTDIRQTIKAPPASPIKIKAEQLDRGVKLFWNLPENIQEAGELLGVNIYRGETASGLHPEPVNQKPLNGNNFDDFSLKNGITYQYGLRSVIKSGNVVVESAMSTIIKASPQAGL